MLGVAGAEFGLELENAHVHQTIAEIVVAAADIFIRSFDTVLISLVVVKGKGAD
jgi:hypothetical protein